MKVDLLSAWVVIWSLYFIFHSDDVYLSRVIIAIISVYVLAIINSLGRDTFGNIYVRLILIMAFLGTIGFFLVFLMGMPALFEYENADGRLGYCFGITCSNSYTALNQTIRYSGFFDEPGAMGLWGSFALLINKLTNNNHTLEILLIVFLCFTFSMGFYLTLALYLCFFLLKKKSLVVFAGVALICGISAFFLLEDDNIYRMTVGRLEYDSTTGTFAGDNRHAQKIIATNMFLENPIIGIGASKTVNLLNNGVEFGDNLMTPFAKDGLVGVLAIYSPFLICFFKCRKDKTAIKCLLIVAASFTHRTITFTTYNIVMYIYLLDVIYHYCHVRRVKYLY